MKASQLSDAMVRCRTFGHAWEDFIPLLRKPTFGERVSLLCIRCQTERHDIISWIDGQLLQREYRYPEGYHLAQKLSRQEFRRIYLRRRRASAKQPA